MAKDKREFNDMHPQFPDPENVACKDCKFRDKTEVDIGGKHLKPGVIRSNCDVFKDKPLEILFNGAPCAFYEKDKG